MTIMKYFRRLFKNQGSKPPVEYVRDEPAASREASSDNQMRLRGCQAPESDIDLSWQSDLEGYAKDIAVSKESIERWISSGLLMPEELKVAEKLVKIMRKH